MPIRKIAIIPRTGCCELDLRYTCIILGTGLICLLGIEAILSPKGLIYVFYLHNDAPNFIYSVIEHVEAFTDWAICFVCNVLLIFGAAINRRWIAALWLITPIVVFIGVPIATIILRYADWAMHKDDRYLLFCEFLLHLCLYFITARYVLAYVLETYIEKRLSQDPDSAKDKTVGLRIEALLKI